MQSGKVIQTGVPSDTSRFINLTLSLAVTDFKLRYYGSVLGYFWSLARPLMLFGVLYVVFSQIVRFGAGVNYFPVVLLTGIVLWTFFAEATSSSVQSLLIRESLLRTMSFPISSIPISTAISSAMNLCMNLLAVFLFIIISGVSISVSWLEFPLLVLVLITMTLPLTLLLSVLYVRYRDIQHIWEVALQIGFWGSPILYPIEKVPESLKLVIMSNPIAVILQQTRHALIDPTAPSAVDAIGGIQYLVIPIAIVLLVATLSIYIFRAQAPYAAEYL